MERKAPRFLGQEVGEAEQALIREIVGTCGGLSRMELAATVGELLGWKRRRGSLKARECREFLEKLEKLESQGGAGVAPQAAGAAAGGKATEVPVTAGGEPGARLVGTARDLGEIRLQQVRTREQRRLFRELVGRYHYLGQRVPFGAHLRYLVYASEPGGAGGGLRAVFERGLADCGARPLDRMGGGDADAPAGARGLEQSLFSVALGPGQEPGEPDLIAGRAGSWRWTGPGATGSRCFRWRRWWIRSATGGAAIGGRTGSSWAAPVAPSGRIGWRGARR